MLNSYKDEHNSNIPFKKKIKIKKIYAYFVRMIKSNHKVFWDLCWLMIRSYKGIIINIYIYIYK